MFDNNKKEQDQYDPAKSGSFAVIRAAVSAYLIWLGYGIVRDAVTGAQGGTPIWVTFAGVVFIVAGIAFAVYAWRRYKRETWLPESDEQNEKNEPSEEEP